jgi:transcription antitermination factor NusG
MSAQSDPGRSPDKAEVAPQHPHQRLNWFVVRTMPQHEKKLAQHFERKRIEFYLPLVRKKRRWSDRIKLIDFPVFPGYVFARFVWSERATEALSLPGALDVVRVDNAPAIMPAEEIENLKLFIREAQELESNPDASFPPGQTVRVTYGPLKGVQGVVEYSKNKARLYVRLPLLGRMVSTEIDASDLEQA